MPFHKKKYCCRQTNTIREAWPDSTKDYSKYLRTEHIQRWDLHIHTVLLKIGGEDVNNVVDVIQDPGCVQFC